MLIIGKKLSPYALLSISGLLAASDQAVKWLVQQSMAYGEYVSVTPFFNWVHLWNTGAAFSLFANGGGWQRYFFIGIAVVVSIFLIKLILENRHKGTGRLIGIFKYDTTAPTTGSGYIDVLCQVIDKN